MSDAESKFAIQNNVNDLFEKPVTDWQKAQNNVVIKAKVKDTDVGAVRERLGFVQESDWTKLVKEYLSYADAQIKRVTSINKSLDSMLKDGKVTDNATYEKYLSLVNSISQVRNKTLKAEFTEQADKISTQLGLGTTDYGEANVASDTSTYSEATMQSSNVGEMSETGAGELYSETGY